ncbi:MULTISPECIES: ABC transporter permease [unclassified Frankia]
MGVLAGLVALIVMFCVWQPGGFATVGNLKNLVSDSSILIVLAMATTFVIVSGQIDLSIGGIIAFTEVITATTFQAMGGTAGGADAILLGFVVALVSGLGWGLLNGLLVTKLKLAAFVATLATLGIAQGAAYVISRGTDLATVPAALTKSVGIGRVFGIPTIVIIAAVVVVAATRCLRRTRFGRYTFAIGSDRIAAQRAGVQVDLHTMRVYALAGLGYGFVAFLNLARFSTTTIGGHSTDALNAITAVALGGASLYGGVGSTIGALIGVFIPAVLQNGFVVAGVDPFYAQISVGVALILALWGDQVRRSYSKTT